MAYVKVTDGAVTQICNLDDPKSRAYYDELMEEKTGYSVVVENTGKPKEFSGNQVKNFIENVRKSAGIKQRKAVIDTNRTVLDEE